MRFAGIILIIFSALSATVSAQQQQFCGIKNNVISNGERVNFTVYYNLSAIWVAAGEAQFSTNLETLDGVPVFHLKGAGKTFKSYDWIYKVNDTYESFIDTNTLLPKKFTRDINENETKKHRNVEYRGDLSMDLCSRSKDLRLDKSPSSKTPKKT